MDYYFNNFQFNGLNLLLLKEGRPFPIRNNEAKLLAFFLANPHQVFSKDAILENVWAGKVVSEQAVFQAISNLRTLFGDEAIRTFPKKGYQWQLPLQEEPLLAEPLQLDISPSAITIAGASAIWPWALAVLVAVGLSLAFYFQRANTALNEVAHKPVRIIVEPFVLDVNSTGARNLAQTLQDAVVKHINQQSSLVVTLPPSNHPPHQVAAEPAHFLNLYNQTVHADILVTGRVRQANDKVYMSFVIQGRENHWKGYLIAADANGLAIELEALLGKIAPINVLWNVRDLRLVNAQLQLLYNENPGSLPMLYQLIDNLLYLGDVDKARLLAVELEQQASSANNIPYQALALQTQALASLDVVGANHYFGMLDKSVALAVAIDDSLLQASLMESYTYMYHRQKNFELMEKNLLSALALAETDRAPEQQARILRLLSIFSYKLKRADKSDLYLNRAKEILDSYQFPSESYALLEDISGMFSDDRAKKEYFFWQALNRFKPEQEAWVKERAQEHLVNLYVDQQRWPDAFAVLAKETTLSGAELWMIAKIHFKQNNFSLAQTQAEAAFKQANISGEYIAGLESSLLLAQIHKQLKQPDVQKNYVEYINKNALASWLKSKQAILLELAGETVGD